MDCEDEILLPGTPEVTRDGLMQDVLSELVSRDDLSRQARGELEHVRLPVPLSDAAVELASVLAPTSKLQKIPVVPGPEESGGVPQVQNLSGSFTAEEANLAL